MDWIDLTLDRNQLRVLAETVMKFGFHEVLGSSWMAIYLAASQKGLSSKGLGS
jgi:hypothetical protein